MGLALVLWSPQAMAQSYLVSGTAEAPLRGAYEITLNATSGITNGFLQNDLQVTFTRGDGTQVTTNGFYDGGNTFKARAYLDSVGDWSWTSNSSLSGLNGGSGAFTVVNNVDLPGKLRTSSADSHQFVQDNGDWFLHIGDTGYSYINSAEPQWQSYIDQSASTGFTKVRTWFGDPNPFTGSIDYMFQGSSLNLGELQTADQRLTYALNNHSEMQMQLIPFGSDKNFLQDYANNDPLVRAYAREVQARYGALPNVQWALSNDLNIANDTTLQNAANTLGTDWDAADPWGTLITNHQARFQSYSFVNAPWSDIVTFENLDQVTGAEILSYRNSGVTDPIVNEEDRYESWRNPNDDRYFFRRLMWSSLLSGGAATYGGGRTWEAYTGPSSWSGVQGYHDLNNAGLLQGGADDFNFIHQFFDDSNLTLIGLVPDDALVGGDAQKFKDIRGDGTLIVYLANPTGTTPQSDNVSASIPSVTIDTSVNYNQGVGDWFNPTTGAWSPLGELDNANRTFTAPGGGDWLLLLKSQNIVAPGPTLPRRFHDDASTKGLWHMDAIDNLDPGSGFQDFVDDDNTFGAPDRPEGRELLLGTPGASSHPTFLPTGGPDGSGALEFDGVDDSGIAFNTWVTPLNGDISIDFSVRPDSLPDLNGDNFMGLVGVLPMQTYLVDDGNGMGQILALTFDSTGSPIFGFSQGGLPLGEWHEVHAQVVGTALDVEVDGITNSYTINGLSDFQSAAVMGRDLNSFSRYFDGALDEVRIATALYVPIPGDFDNDGNVDGADFLVWQQGFGNEFDAADLGNWEANFGAGATLAAATTTAAVVPEPASALLMLLGGVMAGGMRRFRTRLGVGR